MSQPDQRPSPTKEAVTIELPEESVARDGTPKWRRTNFQKIYGCLTYVPPRCRYDPEKPFEFSMGLNLLFGTSILVVGANKALTACACQLSPAALPWQICTTPTQF
jgi:hypothetical protein